VKLELRERDRCSDVSRETSEPPDDDDRSRWNHKSAAGSSLHGNRQIIKAAPKIWQEILFVRPLSTWLPPDHLALWERGRGSDASRETSEPPDDDDRSRWNERALTNLELNDNG
jgi:hypothetical protein